MDVIQYLYPLTFPALITSLIILWSITKCLCKPVAVNKNKNIPRGPPRLPIIGNLHQFGSSPHKNLHSQSRKYGPLMHVRLGSRPRPTLIVSSADAAREIMKTHDITFASPPQYGFQRKLIYDGKDVSFAPYGEYWRQLKSILVLQVLSNKRVQSFRHIREEETALFVKRVTESGKVNLSMMFYNFTNDLICRSAFGRKYSETEDGRKTLRLLIEIVVLLGSFSIGEFIPWLGWINHINGLNKRVDRVAQEVDDFLEGLIEERLRNRKGEKNGEDFLDIILDNYNNENSTSGVSIDRDSLKALLLDVFAGGTDTTSGVLEWAMSELLRQPKVMQKLQSEVRGIVKDKRDITDNDLEHMHYLKAVIKETLRRYPQNPLLIPRLARADVRIMGYDIPAGTGVIINSWAISMDPASWPQPEKFVPERFMNSSVDYKGQHFEFTPFGAGRRGCPGIAFSMATIEFLLANLVQKFDWELLGGAKGEDLDMTERRGMTVRRATPLVAIATQPKVLA